MTKDQAGLVFVFSYSFLSIFEWYVNIAVEAYFPCSQGANKSKLQSSTFFSKLSPRPAPAGLGLVL